MKKLNNKGFAFSTMMYGLVIMMFLIILAIMSTLGNTRRNTKSLGETVEEELNRYTATNTEVKSDEIDSPHTIPTSGWYQIELMSKREGSTDGDYLAGVGYFYAGTILYINAGTNKPQIKYKEKDNGYILMSISDGFPYMSGFAGSNFSGQTKPVIEEDYVPIFYNGLFIKHTNDSGDSKVRITKISDNDRTTPEPITLQKTFELMRKEKCEYVVMEVSSQSLKLGRADHSYFDIGLFLNLSDDHVSKNEHESKEDYFLCKARLFDMVKIGFVNIDDDYGKRIIKEKKCNFETVSMTEITDLSISNRYTSFKTNINNEEWDVYVPILGKFNVFNALFSIKVCNYLGIDKNSIIRV